MGDNELKPEPTIDELAAQGRETILSNLNMSQEAFEEAYRTFEANLPFNRARGKSLFTHRLIYIIKRLSTDDPSEQWFRDLSLVWISKQGLGKLTMSKILETYQELTTTTEVG